MKIKHNSLVEYVILGVLGSLVVLTLAVPPLLRDRRCAPVLSLSVLLRDTDNSWTAARQGMELAADELGAELRFLTLTTSNRCFCWTTAPPVRKPPSVWRAPRKHCHRPASPFGQCPPCPRTG